MVSRVTTGRKMPTRCRRSRKGRRWPAAGLVCGLIVLGPSGLALGPASGSAQQQVREPLPTATPIFPPVVHNTLDGTKPPFLADPLNDFLPFDELDADFYSFEVSDLDVYNLQLFTNNANARIAPGVGNNDVLEIEGLARIIREGADVGRRA